MHRYHLDFVFSGAIQSCPTVLNLENIALKLRLKNTCQMATCLMIVWNQFNSSIWNWTKVWHQAWYPKSCWHDIIRALKDMKWKTCEKKIKKTCAFKRTTWEGCRTALISWIANCRMQMSMLPCRGAANQNNDKDVSTTYRCLIFNNQYLRCKKKAPFQRPQKNKANETATK